MLLPGTDISKCPHVVGSLEQHQKMNKTNEKKPNHHHINDVWVVSGQIQGRSTEVAMLTSSPAQLLSLEKKGGMGFIQMKQLQLAVEE